MLVSGVTFLLRDVTLRIFRPSRLRVWVLALGMLRRKTWRSSTSSTVTALHPSRCLELSALVPQVLEMHDLLFANQAALKCDNIVET